MSDNKADTTTVAGKGRSHRLLVIIVVCIIVVLALVATWRIVDKKLNPEIAETDETVNVMLADAKLTDIQVKSVYTGQLSSESQVSVFPSIPGEVISLDVALGSKVTKGQTLFTVDPSSVQTQADQAKIQLDGISKARKLAKTSLTDANKAKKDAAKVVKKAKQALKQAKAAAAALPPGMQLPGAAAGEDPLSLAAAAVQQAEAGKMQIDAAQKQAQAAYDQADMQYRLAKEGVSAASDAIGKCSVSAPVSGVVTTLTIQKGGVAAQTMPSLVITETGDLVVNTSVAESFVDKLSKGNAADIYIRAVSDEPFSGKIKTVVPSPNQGQTTYPVVISLDSASDKFKPGMFAEIYLVSDSAEGVIAVPSESVIVKSGKEVVAVITDGEKVVFKEVKTGLDNGELVEITSGLSEGERIVYEGQQYLSEESKIKIREGNDK